MLMGLRYHDGNGIDPFYYDPANMHDVSSYIDANTLEPFVPPVKFNAERIDWDIMTIRERKRRRLVAGGWISDPTYKL